MKLPPATPCRRVLIAILASVAFTFAVGRAAVGAFSQLVVFGDSLSDVGNIAAASFDLFPGRYYFNDRFSNGPVFVEALSEGLGLGPTVRSTAGGNNFAYGGAQTSGTGGLQGFVIRDIDEQVDQFLDTRTVDPNALFLVFAGSNDLVNGQTNASVPVNNLAEDIGRLVAAGARSFLLPNLPLLGHTPRFNDDPGTLAQYNARAAQFNAAFDTMLDNLATNNPSLSLFRFDVERLVSQALENPAAFDLTNVTDAAAPGLEPGDSSYNTNQIAANAHEYLFWDDLHPTTTVHAVLAERALALFALPGDYNENGAVDAADYVVWRVAAGQGGPDLAADGNRNGKIDSGDYEFWLRHFGQIAGTSGHLATSAGQSSSVPEPVAPILFTVGVILAPLGRPPRKQNNRIG
jgi:phospholipase/lecithinase/hemolysin